MTIFFFSNIMSRFNSFYVFFFFLFSEFLLDEPRLKQKLNSEFVVLCFEMRLNGVFPCSFDYSFDLDQSLFLALTGIMVCGLVN